VAEPDEHRFVLYGINPVPSIGTVFDVLLSPQNIADATSVPPEPYETSAASSNAPGVVAEFGGPINSVKKELLPTLALPGIVTLTAFEYRTQWAAVSR